MKRYSIIPLLIYAHTLSKQRSLKYLSALLYSLKVLYPQTFKKVEPYINKQLFPSINKLSLNIQPKKKIKDKYLKLYETTFPNHIIDPYVFTLFVLYNEVNDPLVKVDPQKILNAINNYLKKRGERIAIEGQPYINPVQKYTYKEKPYSFLFEIAHLLARKKNVILTAPMGWGKTNIIRAFADSIHKGEFALTGIQNVLDVTNFINAPLDRGSVEDIVHKFLMKMDPDETLLVIDPSPIIVNYQYILLSRLPHRFLIAENYYRRDKQMPSQISASYKDYLNNYVELPVVYSDTFLENVIKDISKEYNFLLTEPQIEVLLDLLKRATGSPTLNLFDFIHTFFISATNTIRYIPYPSRKEQKNTLAYYLQSFNPMKISDKDFDMIIDFTISSGEETENTIMSEEKSILTIDANTTKRIIKSFEYIKKYRIFNQDAALDRMKFYLLARLRGISVKKKPIASLLFVGKTGTGKTSCVEEVTKELRDILTGFGLLKFNMSEFSEAHRVSSFIGSPFGYIGFDRTPPIKKFVNDHSTGIILLDEIEKAHPNLFDLLLGVLDRGELRMGDGTILDLTNYMIVMTSNITTKELIKKEQDNIGFASEEGTKTDKLTKKELNTVMMRFFRPEFVNRIDEIIQFNSLSKEAYKKIIDKLLKDLVANSSILNSVHIEEDLIEHILNESKIETYGGREIERQFTEHVVKPLIEKLISFPSDGKINAIVRKNKIEIKSKEES